MSESYVAVGSSERVVICEDYSPDMYISDGSSSTMVRSYDVPESPLIGHSPFFATAEEAASGTQWLTVADLPWAASDTLYLQAGWVKGMLALRFSTKDGGSRYDINDSNAGTWGMSIAHRDDVSTILGSAATLNLNGLTAWRLGGYWRAVLNTNGGLGDSGNIFNYIYMYSICGILFFRHLTSGDFATIPATYGGGALPYTRLPSLGVSSASYQPSGTITAEAAAESDTFLALGNIDVYEQYNAIGYPDSAVVATHYSTRTLGAYTLAEYITLRLRRWTHCEHLSSTASVYSS